MKIILKIFLIYLFIYTNVSYSKNIVVAESGGHYNKIQSALDVAVAGDTIFVKEKNEPYFEQIYFPRSGNENDGHIVLINYPNEHPIIDGKNFNPGIERPQGLVIINSKSYIKVIGFEIRNIIDCNPKILPSGIWLYGGLKNIEILNNIIHTIQQTVTRSGAHGLAVYGTHATIPISDILIDGNEIYNCKLGASESLVINGNVENFIVSNNRVHDNNNIAFDFIGHERVCPTPELDQARNGLVFGNIAYNIDSRGNQAYGDEANADGFYVDGGRDLIIERNLVYNCNIGIEIASEHGGKSTSGIIVRNNVVRENIVLGIAFGGYDAKRGSTENCIIVNNTLYKNNSENFNYGSAENFSFGAEILVQYYCTNNIVSNNIIYSKSNSPIIANNSNTGADNLFTNNIYYCEANPKWSWGSETYSNFESYKTGSGQEEKSIYADPMFVDHINYDFELKSNSPAIDNGKIIETSIHGDTDYSKNERITNNKIDMGAIEYNNVK